MAQKPSIPKGTRDFSPQEMVRRNYIFDTIRSVYQRYGFLPIETPAMENMETLMGKYGEEGDKLIFKILESGEFSEPIKENLLSKYYELIYESKVRTQLESLQSIVVRELIQIIPLLRICKNAREKKEKLLSSLNLSKIEIDLRKDFIESFKRLYIEYITTKQNWVNDGKSKKVGAIKLYELENSSTQLESNLIEDYRSFLNNSVKLKNLITLYNFLESNLSSKELTKHITKKALRYDLTVPFARYVVMHQNEITFPFKRYQIQPVWRADRPQRGRYREFYQCDADVIGSDSLLNEVELVQIIDDVFTAFKLPVVIKLNNRKILSGIAEVLGESERIIDITVAIDKLDKIGVDGVNKELNEKGVSANAIERLQPLISLQGNTSEKLAVLSEMLASSETGKKGISEIQQVFDTVLSLGIKTAAIEFDVTLARGLNYYTGAIFEVKVDNTRCSSGFTSSILGGGRYDDLTGIFGLKGVSGVGISFGADRIYDVLEELNLYPASVAASTKVMFVNFGTEEEKYCLRLLAAIRAEGISAELYPEQAKMKKQMGYADAKKIPFVVLVGSDEMSSGQLTLKNMQSGEQEKIGIEELIKKLK